MTRDELEYSISQYHDGVLPPLERDRVDEILAGDAGARAILAEYQRLDHVLRTTPSGLPELNWDKVHTTFADAVAACDDAPAVPTFRIGRIATWAGGSVLAAAAVLVFVVTVIWHPPGAGVKPAGSGTLQIAVGPIGLPVAPVVSAHTRNVGAHPSDPAVALHVTATAQIAVGPSPEVASAAWRYEDDGLLVRPSRIAIAGGGEPVQDAAEQLPY